MSEEKQPQARKPMLSVQEALDFMLSAARPVGAVDTIATLEANGRVLA